MSIEKERPEHIFPATKLTFEPVPELTERDRGEMYCYNPTLTNEWLAARAKQHWFNGRTAKNTGIVLGYSKSTIEKYFTCFSRAIRYEASPSPIQVQNPKNPRKSLAISRNERPKSDRQKLNKRLIFNFSTPIRRPHTFRGVTFRRGRGWQAQIRIGKKVKYLGCYPVLADALDAYENAKKCLTTGQNS